MSLSPPAELSSFPQGKLIASRYLIQEPLGWGGMGMVFKALDTALNNEAVALKILFKELSADETHLARFRREVVLARRLAHPNIVRVYDFGGSEDGYYFISMEMLQTSSLRSRISEGACEISEATNILKQICLGLQCAHTLGIQHRDLKPDNILCADDGNLKITDFGTARPAINEEGLTKTGEMIGTPIYISPEMIRDGKTDQRSDLYSLGVMAFELVEGKPPFFSNNWVVLANKHLSAPVPEMSAKDVPEWYKELVRRTLAKDPAGRFDSAGDIIDWIESHEAGKGRNSFSITPFLFLLVSVTITAMVSALITHWYF